MWRMCGLQATSVERDGVQPRETTREGTMFWLGLILTFVGAAGLLRFGLFGLLSGSGAIAGLLAPNRIDEKTRKDNIEFLKDMGIKVAVACIALGVGFWLMETPA